MSWKTSIRMGAARAPDHSPSPPAAWAAGTLTPVGSPTPRSRSATTTCEAS